MGKTTCLIADGEFFPDLTSCQTVNYFYFIYRREILFFFFLTVSTGLTQHGTRTLIYRVRTGPGKPGKSWNFIKAFSRTG